MIEWNSLEISSRKLEIPREHCMQRWAQKSKEIVWPNRSRWYCEEVARIHRKLYKRDLHDPDKHDDVITHLEQDVLECEGKWALGSITTNKASEDDEILVVLFQILKDDAVKVLHSICQQIWKTQQWPEDQKRCFHSNPKERKCRRMLKLPHNCTHLTC